MNAKPHPDQAGRRRLAILGFHKIGPPPPDGWESWFYIPEETFAAQLRELATGWEVIDLATFLIGLDHPERLPDRAALLTFDDGQRSMREVALPWLVRLGCPAVLFVPTDFVGATSVFDPYEPEEPICDWDELDELERHGVAVQSHGASHRGLSGLDAEEQRSELVRSRAAIEARLGRPAEVFAYPYGDAGRDPATVARALRAAGYRAAFGYPGGPAALPISDRYRLPRIAMGPDTELAAALDEAAAPAAP